MRARRLIVHQIHPQVFPSRRLGLIFIMLVLILLIVPAVKPSQIYNIFTRLKREANPGLSYNSGGKIVKKTKDSGLTNLLDSVYVGPEYSSNKRRISSTLSQCPRCPSCSVSNKLKDFGVDHRPNKGDDAILECGYLGGNKDKLVSLEWEKDEVTFFRYFEKRTQKTQIIPQKWLRLEDISYEKSSERVFNNQQSMINKLIVTLHNVEPEMGGKYTCVVSFNVEVVKTDDDDVIMLGRIQRDAPLTVNDVTVAREVVEGDPPTRPDILMDLWEQGYDRKKSKRLFWNDNLSMEEVADWVEGDNYTMTYEDEAMAYLECVSNYDPNPHLSWSYIEGDPEEGELHLIKADASELVHFHKNGKITRLGLRVKLGNKWEFHCQLTPRNEAASPITSAVKAEKNLDYDDNVEWELWFIGEISNDPEEEEATVEVTVNEKLPWTILMAIGAGAGLILAICLACCCCRCRARRKRLETERKKNAIVEEGRGLQRGQGGERGKSSKRKAPKPAELHNW